MNDFKLVYERETKPVKNYGSWSAEKVETVGIWVCNVILLGFIIWARVVV